MLIEDENQNGSEVRNGNHENYLRILRGVKGD